MTALPASSILRTSSTVTRFASSAGACATADGAGCAGAFLVAACEAPESEPPAMSLALHAPKITAAAASAEAAVSFDLPFIQTSAFKSYGLRRAAGTTATARDNR